MSQQQSEKEESNIWQSILSDVTKAKTQETKNLIILGDRGCGKSNLINYLRGGKKKEPSSASVGELALSYTTWEVTVEDNEDALGRLGVWQLEGSEKYGDLLEYALNAKTIEHSLVLITLDFSKPWDFLDSLQKWATLLENAIEQKLPRAVLEEAREQNRLHFLQYKESPEDGRVNSINVVQTEVQANLPKGALTKNLGVPIVVACTKADSIAVLEKTLNFGDGEFDVIQQHLRKFCLRYGATLCYVSIRQNKNASLLAKYIQSRLFGTPFHEKPQFLVKETVFIPSGWDSLGKLNLLVEKSPLTEDTDEVASFKGLIMVQAEEKMPESSTKIEILDEQEFLRKLQNGESIEEQKEQSKDPSTPADKKNAKAKAPTAQNSPAKDQSVSTEVLQKFFSNLVKKNPQGAKESGN